ncbi:MAG: divalent metal cation transporter [Bacteroidales bacterium]|nr:divalent metal cation transporter [Bacteroidales bacterium]
MKKRLLNILFWSIISAAFIGPGTITTAAKAGASFQFDLLWALVFSTIACLVLQEAAARLSIVSNQSLGNAVASQFANKKGGWLIFLLIIGAIIIGSAAYQTGNLLGASEGILVLTSINAKLIILALGVLAGIILLFPSLQFIARGLGLLVVLMGFAFITTAILIKPNYSDLIHGSLVPSLPEGSALLILGLIGTTVVPYNLFLGSGITDKSQSIQEMRFGISIAILLGGITSMAVLIVGTSAEESFSFLALAKALTQKLGAWAVWFFGFGLFAAGFSSSITAPLASAITAKDLFEKRNTKSWGQNGIYFKAIWGLVLLTGLAFGLVGFKPIPAIIFAQALNGLILPFISIFLWIAINNVELMKKQVNNLFQNILFAAIVWISLVLGLWNISKAITTTFGMDLNQNNWLIYSILGFSFFLTLRIAFRLAKNREPQNHD